jgi:hypothetical protein
MPMQQHESISVFGKDKIGDNLQSNKRIKNYKKAKNKK